MSLAEFADAYPAESELVERKTGTGTRPLQEAFVAFSNAGGGVVLIGVTDDGHINGRRLDAGVEAAVQDAAAEARNVPAIDLVQIDVEDTPVTLVVVPAQTSGVAQTSDGRVLIRRGARNRPLFGAQLLDLLQKRSHEPFDSTDSGSELAEAPTQHREELRAAFGWSEDDEVQGLMERGLLRTDGVRLTVAGALFLSRQLPRRFAKAEIEVRRFPDDGRDYIGRTTFDGPLHHQVARALVACRSSPLTARRGRLCHAGITAGAA